MTALTWTHATTEIPENGLAVQRSATAGECEAVRAALDVIGCSAIDVRYRIRAVAGDAFRLVGTFKAKVTQACVVGLEPVDEVVTGDLDIEFTPKPTARSGKGEADDGDPFAKVDIEPVENGTIDVGRVLFEEIAANLDPYPRANGSTFDWQDPRAAKDQGPAVESPFAKLAALKRKKPEEG